MNPLVAWVKAREDLRKKKESGVAPPWTDDPILQTYRFCNAFREDDKVTRWIFDNWLYPNRLDPDVWFAMAVARHINLPDTLAEIGYPVPWNPKKFMAVMRQRKKLGLTAYNSAYLIRASGTKGQEKAAYLRDKVLGPLWRRREKLRPVAGDTLDGFHKRLLSQFGLGSFMAAQIVADVKHVAPLRDYAVDWMEFAASGPGSKRGLNRLLGRPVKSPWKEEDWRSTVLELRVVLKAWFESENIPWCDAQNTQNELCEFDKYERVRLGEGRPKRKYVIPGPQLT